MRPSQVASGAGVNLQTLRYYERRGLIPLPRRLLSGYRSYDPAVVGRVRFVKAAQQLGFSLDGVTTLLDLAGGGPDNCDAARLLAVEKIDQLDAKIATLSAMRESLRQLVATCERPPDRRECPLLDTMARRGDMEPDQ